MTRAIDTSLTLFDSTKDGPLDVHTFADATRYFSIRNQHVGDALGAIAQRDARRRRVQVGGAGRAVDVEFFVLDLPRDKALSREIAKMLHDAFVDATASALKTTAEKDGFLDASATGTLDAVEEVIELRRFIANARVAKGGSRKRELLFHHAMPEAAE